MAFQDECFIHITEIKYTRFSVAATMYRELPLLSERQKKQRIILCFKSCQNICPFKFKSLYGKYTGYPKSYLFHRTCIIHKVRIVYTNDVAKNIN